MSREHALTPFPPAMRRSVPLANSTPLMSTALDVQATILFNSLHCSQVERDSSDSASLETDDCAANITTTSTTTTTTTSSNASNGKRKELLRRPKALPLAIKKGKTLQPGSSNKALKPADNKSNAKLSSLDRILRRLNMMKYAHLFRKYDVVRFGQLREIDLNALGITRPQELRALKEAILIVKAENF